MVGIGNVCLGDVLHQLLLHLIGRIGTFADETEPVGDAIHMGIHRQRGLAEGDALHDVGSLPADARQIQQLVHIRRHLAAVLRHQCSRHRYQMGGFRVGVGDAADVFQHVLGLCLRHRLRIRVATKQVGRHLIDALVRTLRTEDDCYQQLEHTTELQFCIHIRHLRPEVGQYPFISFFPFHIVWAKIQNFPELASIKTSFLHDSRELCNFARYF